MLQKLCYLADLFFYAFVFLCAIGAYIIKDTGFHRFLVRVDTPTGDSVVAHQAFVALYISSGNTNTINVFLILLYLPNSALEIFKIAPLFVFFERKVS